MVDAARNRLHVRAARRRENAVTRAIGWRLEVSGGECAIGGGDRRENAENERSPSYSLNMSYVALLGCTELEADWKRLCTQLRHFQFDAYDYTAFIMLTIFNPDGWSRRPAPQPRAPIDCSSQLFTGVALHKEHHAFQSLVAQTHTELLCAWAEYRRQHPANMHLSELLAQFR